MTGRKEFSPDWDSFIRKTKRLSLIQRSAMYDEARLSSRLLLIVGVEAEIRARNTRLNNMQRLAAAQRRITAQRRLTAAPYAFRNYLTPQTRQMMPAPRLHLLSLEAHRSSLNTSRHYFRTIDPTRSIFSIQIANRAVKEQKTHFQLWRVSHPFGGPVSDEELLNLRRSISSLNPTKRRRRLIEPAGISESRALEIAIQSLNNRS